MNYMAKNNDKTQGMVFILPKSKEFFGRIAEDFQKTGLSAKEQPKIISQRAQLVSSTSRHSEVEAKKEIQSLKELKENLTKLTQLHNKLKSMLEELGDAVEEDEIKN